MFGGVGPMEVVLVLAIALIVLGPKKLPEAARSVGKGLREFKDSVQGIGDDLHHEDDDEPRDHHDPTPVAAAAEPVAAASEPEATKPPQ